MSQKKTKVLLVSRKSESATQILEQLNRIPAFEVFFEETSTSALRRMAKSHIDSLILNFEELGSSQIRIIRDVRDIGLLFQILCFADSVEPTSMEELRSLGNIVVLEKPLIDLNSDLVGLCTRVLKSLQVSPRKSKRYKINEKVQIEDLVNEKVYQGIALNLSESGGYFEVKAPQLSLAQDVKITFDLQRIKQTRSLYGYVAWMEFSGAEKIQIGVKFANLSSSQLKKAS